ncbi:MAG: chemotaxis protein CheB, partial [Geminicoccaceae bacterium]
MDDIPARHTVRPAPADALDCRSKPLGVVGIGAGAGGIEAVQLLFGAMPIDAGLAFVVCRRIQPGLSDPLADLLRTQTAMPVIPAESGMTLEAGRIYLAAPEAQMIVLKDRLVSLTACVPDALSEVDETELSCSPIDLLLHSLSASKGRSAIAIVLSSNDQDGVRGCASIRNQGGLVLAQHPESTEFAELPRRVVEADLAQAVAPPGAMADLIQRHIGKSRGAAVGMPATGQGDEEALRRIAGLLDARFDVDMSAYRPSMVAKRVRRRLSKSKAATLFDYAGHLAIDEAELSALHDDLMIGVTTFFRDPEAFTALKQQVLPALVERMSAQSPIRIWVPASASGEEAYSLAMLFLDQIDEGGKQPHLDILASDRHAPALERARLGRYRHDHLGNVPPELVQRYMRSTGEHIEAGPELRRHVTFVEHDILKAPPPDDIDLVSCR